MNLVKEEDDEKWNLDSHNPTQLGESDGEIQN